MALDAARAIPGATITAAAARAPTASTSRRLIAAIARVLQACFGFMR